MIELRYLEEYVVFTKTLSVPLAAEELFVSQPTLRAHLKAIEEDLGAPLVTRRDSETNLSPVGRLLLRKARDIVSYTNSAIGECRICAQSTEAVFVGDLGYRPFDALLYEARERYREQYDGDSIELYLSNGMCANAEALRDGTVDITLLSHVRGIAGQEELTAPGFPPPIKSLFLDEAEVLFWVLQESPLFSKPSITCHDLEGLTLLLGASENMTAAGTVLHDRLSKCGVMIDVCNMPFSSYPEYRLSGNSSTFGITLRKPEADGAIRVFRLEDLRVTSDLLVLCDQDTISPAGMRYFDVLSCIIEERNALGSKE